MKNLKIGTKLIGGFIIVALIGCLVGLIGITNIRTIETADQKLYEKVTLPLGVLGKITENFQRTRINLRDVVTAETASERQEAEGKIRELRAETAKLTDEFHKTILTDEGRRLFAEFVDARADYGKVIDYVLALNASNRAPEAEQYLKKEGKEVALREQEKIDRLIESKEVQAKLTAEENTQVAATASMTMGALALVALATGIAVGWFITSGIRKQLTLAVGVADAISRGDLTVKVEVTGKDELSLVLGAMKSMVENLTRIVSDVQSAADNVASGSQELSSSSQEMSQGSTEQAASIEEISSSMEEMVANIQQNTDNAKQTEQLAARSAVEAAEGGKAVGETVRAMKEIAEKISIIEEIARQTNLLALNAAIEAARAGEAGKGFAVVASEVRKLAERSQTAAAQISSLSSSSVEIAEKAGQMLEKLVPAIQRTAELVQEVAAASMEQNTGASQVNKAIQQLDTVVQQNASSSEEMASTAEELSSQSEQLQDAAAFFKLDGTAASRAHRAPPAVHKTNAPPKGRARPMLAPPSRKVGKGIALDLDHSSDDSFESY